MAGLREAVKDYQEELRGGIAWVVFWREGRSWNSDYLYLEAGNDSIEYDDMSRLEQIQGIDSRAVALNGYYCGRLSEDMSIDELAAGVRWHYENEFNSLAAFIEAHNGAIPPEQLEKARQTAHAAGLPFSERPYDGREFNPYVFDGSMTPEDYELMQKMIAEERSDQMSEHALEAYISNRGKYVEGEPMGEWVKFPATPDELNEVMRRIGMDGIYYTEWFMPEYNSSIPGLARGLSEFEQFDGLNYLGKLLQEQSDAERGKFTAAVAHGEYAGNIKDLINLAQNLDCYELYPSVLNEEQYGYFLIDELNKIALPQEARVYFDYESYGSDTMINEGGQMTAQGYIYNNRSHFTEYYDGREVPEEYRVTNNQQPPRLDPDKTDYDAIGTRQAATLTAAPPQPRPVLPIVLTADKPGEKMKEITDKLEAGIQAIFSSEQYADYLKAMSKFHDYSLNNTILIAMQGGNLVKGFRQWQTEFDRHVKAGEKGIKILAPAPFKVKQQMEKIDPNTQKPFIGKDGKPITEEKEITIPAFKVVSVFDVSQTEGKEIPDISAQNLVADVEQYDDFFKALENASPVPIAFEKIESGANGYYHLEDKRIAIKEGESQLQVLKTAIHEIAHAKLHDIDLNAPKNEQNRVDRRTREVQAESVAYAVCQHFGLDTSEYSFAYVAGWSSGKEMSELKASLETIQSTARELINGIEGHFADLQQQREQSPVFPTLPPEQQKELSDTVQATLQFLIDADIKAHGEVTGDTLHAIAVQGYAYNSGQLEKRVAEPQPGYTEWSEPATAENAPDNPGVPSDDIGAYLPQQDKDTFSIYQLKGGDETRDFRYEPYERLQAAGLKVDAANYEHIYTAPLTQGEGLSELYTRFNLDMPQGFKGHPLSISDVIVFHQDGQDAAHYVDRHGDFQNVPEFLGQQPQELVPDDFKTGEKIQTPRGNFSLTDMTREQIEAAGYGFHHQSDDGKYLIMANGTQAFAIAAQPENYLKHIEDAVEQNDNSFDGIINNMPPPTVGELEQKIKAGEPISLVALAKAVKDEKRETPQKKPSIRKQLDEYKKQAKAQQPAKQRVKEKQNDLEV